MAVIHFVTYLIWSLHWGRQLLPATHPLAAVIQGERLTTKAEKPEQDRNIMYLEQHHTSMQQERHRR